MARVLQLPDRGRLIVCTDLQGCLRDFEAVVDIFLRRLDETGDAHVIFTGDLIHGPRLSPEEWPDFLGEFYCDQSGEVVEAFVELRAAHPGRVHAILGNHEHGHIGGPHTAKFARDEVMVLEAELGPQRAAWLRSVLAELPLVAMAPCGAVFTHGAPAAEVDGPQSIEKVELDVAGNADTPVDIFDVPVLGAVLWARSADPRVAQKFLAAMGGTISIYGHDVIPTGFERVGAEQIVVSTSFGVPDSRKVYLELDLARRYESVAELAVGAEILPLYPKVAPRRLGGRGPDW